MSTALSELAGIEAKSRRYMRLHVATKLFLPLSISIAIVFANDPLKALSVAVISAGACVAAGVPLGTLRRYLLLLVSISTFVILAFSLFANIPGKIIFEIELLKIQAEKGVFEWKLCVTEEGLYYSATFVLRIVAMILTAVLVMASITDRDLVWGLLSLRVPLGACVAASLFFRGVQLFASDFFTVREAMMARGVDFERVSLAKKFSLYANALIPLFSLMITRSYEVSLALEARGISPTIRSSSGYYVFRMGKDDYLVIALSVVLMLALGAWRWLL